MLYDTRRHYLAEGEKLMEKGITKPIKSAGEVKDSVHVSESTPVKERIVRRYFFCSRDPGTSVEFLGHPGERSEIPFCRWCGLHMSERFSR